MKPLIQLALDFINLDRALKVAVEAASRVDIIEAGTPLIKSEGLDSVRKLREEFPDKMIMADMKIMDAGRIEVESAAKAGADIVDVCGQASDATIKECVEAGRNYGVKIVVDLIGVDDVVERAKQVSEWGVDYVSVHIGIDEQMQAKTSFDIVEKVVAAVEVPVGVAGGLNTETVLDAVNAGASIVIIGGAITKSDDVCKTVKDFRNAVDSGKKIKSVLYKRSQDIRSILEKVSSANLSDALHRKPAFDSVKQVSPGKFVGEVVTCRTYPGDWAKPVEAIDAAKKGDVIVIDAGGMGPAIWGELATESALKKKLSGVIIYGAIRDIEEIKALGFPAYASMVTPNAGEPKGFGEINVPLNITGVEVSPGDWVIGDEDGVIVLPKQKAVEYANRAQDVLERETRLRKEIRDGSTLSKVAHLLKWEKKS